MGQLRDGRALSSAALAAVRWEHTTAPFQALGYRFAVRSSQAGIGRFVDEMYAACAVEAAVPPPTCYSIVHDLEGGEPHALYVGAEQVVRSSHPAPVLNHLTWHVNQQVVAHSGHVVLVHAAAAALDGVGVVLPAAMEAGKTTLVAGLVKAGFGYLTDEATAIDPVTLRMHPYPKPLSIDPGTWSVHADLRPRPSPDAADYLRDQWQVAPQRIRADAATGPVDVALAIFPRYRPGARTTVEPLRRSEALVTMLEQTFRFHESGRRNLEVLGRLLADVRCYRLVSGDLGTAVTAVERLVRGTAAPRGARGGSA